jgi:hypothetical protein
MAAVICKRPHEYKPQKIADLGRGRRGRGAGNKNRVVCVRLACAKRNSDP